MKPKNYWILSKINWIFTKHWQKTLQSTSNYWRKHSTLLRNNENLNRLPKFWPFWKTLSLNSSKDLMTCHRKNIFSIFSVIPSLICDIENYENISRDLKSELIKLRSDSALESNFANSDIYDFISALCHIFWRH